MDNQQSLSFGKSLSHLFNRLSKLSVRQILQKGIDLGYNSFRLNFKQLFLIFSAIGFFLVFLLWVGRHYGIDLDKLTRDPNAVFDSKFYVGLVSHLGIFLWATTVSICFYTSSLLRNTRDTLQIRSFLNWSAVISSILALDDLFQIHEIVFARILGIPEKYFYYFYFLYMLVYSVFFFKILLNKNIIILALAYCMFIGSMVLDRFHIHMMYSNFFEDSFKFVGICLWTFYFMKNCYELQGMHLFNLKRESGRVG